MQNYEKMEEILKEIKKLNDDINGYLTNSSDIKRLQSSAYWADKISSALRTESIKQSGVFVEKPITIKPNNDINFNYCVKKIWNSSVIFTMPALLNFRVWERKNQVIYTKNFTFVSEVLADKLSDFCQSNHWKISKEKYTLIVINVVSEDTPKYFISDTDNRYYTELNNVIKQFFIPDDSYEYLSFYYDTEKFGSISKTVVILVSEEDKYEAFQALKENKSQLLQPESFDLSKNKTIKFRAENSVNNSKKSKV